MSAFVFLSSCEKHDWEDTKLLHVDKAEKHGADAGHGKEDSEKKEEH